MNSEIEIALERFIKAHKDYFTLADLRKSIPLSFITDDYLSDYLCGHPHVFFQNGAYISRCGIFSNKEFSISPLMFERRDGILVIGHRCVPFVNPEIFPFDITFVYQGKEIPKKTITIYTQKALEHYTFFGQEYALDFFSHDPANAAISFYDREGLPTSINLTVLDMDRLYKEWNFRRGDRIGATVTDWQHSVVELFPVSSKSGSHLIGSDEDRFRRYWMEVFENTLLDSNSLNGPCESIEEQLANVFMYEGEILFSHQSSSIEEMLLHTKQLCIAEYGVETRLWKKNEEIPIISYDDETGGIRFLDIIWGTNNATLPEIVINALLYDSLYKKETSVFPLVERMLNSDTLNNSVTVQQVINHLEQHREHLEKSYNWFGDFDKAKLREKILDLYIKIFDFVCTVDSVTDNLLSLPQPPLIVITQLHGHILFMLNSLAPEGMEQITESEIELFYQSLEGMVSSFDDIKETLSLVLENTIRRRFFIV